MSSLFWSHSLRCFVKMHAQVWSKNGSNRFETSWDVLDNPCRCTRHFSGFLTLNREKWSGWQILSLEWMDFATMLAFTHLLQCIKERTVAQIDLWANLSLRILKSKKFTHRFEWHFRKRKPHSQTYRRMFSVSQMCVFCFAHWQFFFCAHIEKLQRLCFSLDTCVVVKLVYLYLLFWFQWANFESTKFSTNSMCERARKTGVLWEAK